MIDTTGDIDRIAPTLRPDDAPIGYHRWSNLLFVHWQISPSELAPLIPKQLSIDTFEGSAWVGLVPFHMSGVRPWWAPVIPGISSFHETNLRTYVHFNGQDPGVWFFSLDASSSFAVNIARRRWQLPYHRANMHVRRMGTSIRYSSQRLWPGTYGVGCSIEAEIGDFIPALERNLNAGQSLPGTLEHFLAERYILYSQGSDGRLLQGRVHHKHYPLREAKTIACEESLLKDLRIEVDTQEQHVLFSEGVDVEIFKMQSMTR